MIEWFHRLMSGKDNTTPDMGRWSWLVSSVAIIGAALLNWWHRAEIDLGTLAAALGGNATLHGITLNVKKDTEPPPKDAP